MSEPEDSGNPNDQIDKPELLTFEERIAHLDAGYRNSQSVVRFLDTKAAATIGAVPVLLGILAAVFAWLHDESKWAIAIESIGACLPLLLGSIVSLALLIVSLLTIKAAFSAIDPRDPGSEKASVLFPYKSSDFASRLAVFTGDPRSTDAIEDYRRQLTRMSEIVSVKMAHVKQSIYWLKRLFVVLAFALSGMLLIAGLGLAVSGQ